MVKELNTIHDMETFTLADAANMNWEERKAAVSSLMSLKEKNNGNIKGQACANGAKQREYIKKEDASSPTASTESVVITHSYTRNLMKTSLWS